MRIGNLLIPITIILLLAVSTTSGAIDTTKIGIEKGDTFNYKLNTLNDDFQGLTEICFVCDDTGTDFLVSEGEEFSVEIKEIDGNTARAIYKNDEQEIEKLNVLDERTQSDFLNTDWDNWAVRFADDWAWALEAAADPLVFWEGWENLVNFEVNIAHQVEGDVFNTVLDTTSYFNTSNDIETIAQLQHIEYDLITGAISLIVISATNTFYDGTIKNFQQEIELISSSEGGFLPISYSWFLVGLVVLVLTRPNRSKKE